LFFLQIVNDKFQEIISFGGRGCLHCAVDEVFNFLRRVKVNPGVHEYVKTDVALLQSISDDALSGEECPDVLLEGELQGDVLAFLLLLFLLLVLLDEEGAFSFLLFEHKL
jgi:hypothetical protein